jgi:hypothetical protein
MTIKEQGTRPRLESGATLVFLDPAGLNFAMGTPYGVSLQV